MAAQWVKTQGAIHEAEALGKIVQERLEEATHKASLSNRLKRESDNARQLEVEARNEARLAAFPPSAACCCTWSTYGVVEVSLGLHDPSARGQGASSVQAAGEGCHCKYQVVGSGQGYYASINQRPRLAGGGINTEHRAHG